MPQKPSVKKRSAARQSSPAAPALKADPRQALVHAIAALGRTDDDRPAKVEYDSAVSALVQRYLHDHGGCFRTDSGGIWVQRATGRAILVDPPSAKVEIEEATGIASLDLRSIAHAAAVRACTYNGDPGTVVTMSALQGRHLLIRASDSELFKLARDGISRVPNGTDGVLVLPNSSSFAEVPPLGRGGRRSARLDVLHRFVASWNVEGMDRAEVQAVVITWLASALLPRAIVGARPLLLLLGPTASGKSALARCLGKLLQGPSFEVSVGPSDQRDMETAFVRSPIVALDDIEVAPPWLRGLVRTAVTGGQIARRKLYTTSSLSRALADAALIVTAKMPPLSGADDLANRCVPLRLLPRDGGFRSEGNLSSLTAEMRPQVWAGLLDLLQRALPTLLRGGAARQRLAGYEHAARALARAGGFLPALERALAKVEASRPGVVLEEDPLPEDLCALMDGEAGEIEGSSADLLRRLQGAAPDRYRQWTPERLGRGLADRTNSLEEVGLHVERLTRTAQHRGWRIRRLRRHHDRMTG